MKRIINFNLEESLPKRNVKAMRGDAASIQIRVLDGPALRALSTELNSSKYAIDAHNRSIEEIGNLSEFPKLCALDVSFNRLTSLRNINTARDLRELKVYNNKLTTTVGLKVNSNLEGLLMNDNQIEEISNDFLALGKLKNLWLNGNRVTSVQNLRSCRLLVQLDLGRNRLEGVASEGLETLTNLEHLNLMGNQLSSVGSLAHLTKLEELNLSENSLTSLQGLLPPNLIVLRINANQISDFQGLVTTLPKLNELYAHDNAIVEIEALPSRCPQLESLDVRNNRIRSSAQLTLLSKCEALQDLWLQGNPCCSSSSYLLEVATALPELKTLDAFTDAQLHSQLERLKNGTISQEDLLNSSRLLTPSYRPGTAMSRPGSSNGIRPPTPSGRPATPESAPIFHKPSSRIGNLAKLTTPAELAKAQEQVHERLQKMKQLLYLVGTTADETAASGKLATPAHQDAGQQRHSVGVMSSMPAAMLGNDRVPMVGIRSTSGRNVTQPPYSVLPTTASANCASSDIERLPKIAYRARTVQSLIRRSCVDAGTDPLESLMGSNQAIVPPSFGRGCEIETQTALPPAVPIAIAASYSSGDLHSVLSAPMEEQHGQNDTNTSEDAAKTEVPREPQHNGEALEVEMKLFLLQHTVAVSSSEDNQQSGNDNQPEDDNEDATKFWSDSPRLNPVKRAEQRKPPNLRSRTGYRAFRMPSRPSSANDA